MFPMAVFMSLVLFLVFRELKFRKQEELDLMLKKLKRRKKANYDAEVITSSESTWPENGGTGSTRDANLFIFYDEKGYVSKIVKATDIDIPIKED